MIGILGFKIKFKPVLKDHWPFTLVGVLAICIAVGSVNYLIHREIRNFSEL